MRQTWIKRTGFLFGLVVFAAFLMMDLEPGKPQVSRMAAVAALMAIWWITEAMPIAATALLPVVLYPLLSIDVGKVVAKSYMNSTIFLFLGGFLVALTIERWNLHRRMALRIIRLIGTKPRRVILGFMVASAVLSMWISNTATAMMMLPIALSVLSRAREGEGDSETVERFGLLLMLGVAYGASIGGMGTLIGTPPNLAFSRIFAETFPGAPEITFSQWLLFALPLVIVFLGVAWAVLVYLVYPIEGKGLLGSREAIDGAIAKLGAMGTAERRVLVAFITAAFLWMFRADLRLGFVNITGWASFLGLKGYVDDGTVAVAVATALFLIPSGEEDEGPLLDWETASGVPWGILLLFGGGFALAAGFKSTGLADTVGRSFASFGGGLPPLLLVAATAFLLTFLTELTSNTATTNAVLPILASVASKGLGLNPLLLMLPATLSASCAFCLPVATPPNAIVFGSGYVTIGKMAKAGIVLNLIGVVLVTIVTYVLAPVVFGVSFTGLPLWAR